MYYSERNLETIISQRGVSYDAIAGNLGISENAFRNKRKGRTEFTQSEIGKLTEFMRLSTDERDSIFFNSNVD